MMGYRKEHATTQEVRRQVLAILGDNRDDWFTASELWDGIDHPEVGHAKCLGNYLRAMHAEGLVARRVEGGNTPIWAITPDGAGWSPAPYQSRNAKAKAKAQAPAVSAQGAMRPQNGRKPAPNHPFNVTPAVAKEKRPAPVTRPLPAHLESKPDMAKKKEKPQTYADLRLAEIKGEGLPVKTYPPSVLDALIKEVLPADEPSAALWIPNEPLKITEELNPMPTTTPEQPIAEFKVDPIEAFVHASQPIQPTRPACQGHCANHHHASEEAIDQEAARRQLHEAQVAREAYIAHLLTIADEHASTGDDLGVSPTWKSARRLAPHFGLEASYA